MKFRIAGHGNYGRKEDPLDQEIQGLADPICRSLYPFEHGRWNGLRDAPMVTGVLWLDMIRWCVEEQEEEATQAEIKGDLPNISGVEVLENMIRLTSDGAIYTFVYKGDAAFVWKVDLTHLSYRNEDFPDEDPIGPKQGMIMVLSSMLAHGGKENLYIEWIDEHEEWKPTTLGKALKKLLS